VQVELVELLVAAHEMQLVQVGLVELLFVAPREMQLAELLVAAREMQLAELLVAAHEMQLVQVGLMELLTAARAGEQVQGGLHALWEQLQHASHLQSSTLHC